MREAVIVDSVRSPLGKSFRGSFNITRPDDILAHCIRSVVGRVPQIEASEVEEVVAGCGFPEGQQGMNIARIAALRAGLPTSVSAMTVNRFCSSGLQAVALAAHQIINEGVEVAIGCGVESITQIFNSRGDKNPWVDEKYPGIYMVMGDTCEILAKRYGVTRQSQDELSLMSQQRTARAQREGLFDAEIVPMRVTRAIIDRKTGETTGTEEHVIEKDECNRADTTLEALQSLKPYFDPEKGSITAGNASQLSDGAAAVLMMSRDRANALGLKPKLVFRGFAVAGCEPEEMGLGPALAVPKLLNRHKLKVSDIDLWELNEAFAAQVVYCRDKLGIPQEKLNVNGGSISIGHPYGATGARMVGTLANEMQRRGARFGVVTMCIGGGQGAAGLFELCK